MMLKFMKNAVFSGLIICLTLAGYAQKVSGIKTVFPEIQLNLMTVQTLAPCDIIISEQGDSIAPINVQLIETRQSKSAICILFESSEVTHGEASNKAIVRIIDEISAFISEKQNNVAIGLAYYNRAEKNNLALHKLGKGFSNNVPEGEIELLQLKDEIRYESPWTDMYKAAFEALDWMHSFSAQFDNMALVILGTGKALSESPIRANECINKSLEFNIPIYTIGVKSNDRYAFDNMRLVSEKSHGIFTESEHLGDITEVLRQISTKEQKQFFEYALSYNTLAKADGKTHIARVCINDTALTFNFTTPLIPFYHETWFYFTCGGCSLLFIVLLIWMVIRFQRKKSQGQSDEKQTHIAEHTKYDSATITTDTYFGNADKTKVSENSESKQSIKYRPAQQSGSGHTQINVPPIGFIISINGVRKKFELSQGKTRLGRLPDNDIKIPDPSVSGNHLIIEYEDQKCFITNLSKSNGTLLGGKQISSTLIYAGQTIKLGLVEITFI